MRLFALLLAAAFFIVGPLRAQVTATEGEVFLAAELDRPPRLTSVHMRYHPRDRLDQNAVVVLQFVVDTLGHPEPGSARILGDPDSLFAVAATMTVLASEYSPGKSRGLRVRVLMQDTVRLRAKDSRCDFLVAVNGAALCADSVIAGH